MKVGQVHAGQSLERVRQFLDAHPDQLGAVNGSDARTQLDTAIARVRAAVDMQGICRRVAHGEVRNRKAQERTLVLKYMTPVAKFARAKLKGVPHIAALTPSAGILTGIPLANAGRAMAAAAAPYADRFRAANFPAGFLDQLAAAAEAIATSLAAAADSRRQRNGATKEIAAALKEGRNAVAALDSLVSHTIIGNDKLVEEWRVARRITKSTGARSRVVLATEEVLDQAA